MPLAMISVNPAILAYSCMQKLESVQLLIEKIAKQVYDLKHHIITKIMEVNFSLFVSPESGCVLIVHLCQ